MEWVVVPAEAVECGLRLSRLVCDRDVGRVRWSLGQWLQQDRGVKIQEHGMGTRKQATRTLLQEVNACKWHTAWQRVLCTSV